VQDQRAGDAFQRALVVGWAASAPFSSIARDGAQAALAEGSVSLDLGAHEGLRIRQQRVLDWRRLLPPATAHECSAPAIEFQLKDAGLPCTMLIALGGGHLSVINTFLCINWHSRLQSSTSPRFTAHASAAQVLELSMHS
jgi:hypothetical protein